MGYLFDIYNFKTKNRYNGFPLISCASLSTGSESILWTKI